jgi:hypothetical protein
VRDFGPIHVELITPDGARHKGFVFVPTTYHLTKAEVGRLVTALESKLAVYPADLDLANAETWLYPATRRGDKTFPDPGRLAASVEPE